MKCTFSEHQRRILILAFKEKFLTCQEILAMLWGVGARERETPQYARGHSSLSRCLTRLWRRGLIEYWKTLTRQRTGISLTSRGKLLALKLIEDEEKRGGFG